MLLWTVGFMYSFEYWFLVFFGCILRSKLLDHMVALFLVFWGSFILFSVVPVAVYISTNSVGGVPFLHILTNICYLHTSLCVCVRVCVLICISLMISYTEHLFMCCYWVFLNWYIRVQILTPMQFLLYYSHLDVGSRPFLVTRVVTEWQGLTYHWQMSWK